MPRLEGNASSSVARLPQSGHMRKGVERCFSYGRYRATGCGPGRQVSRRAFPIPERGFMRLRPTFLEGLDRRAALKTLLAGAMLVPIGCASDNEARDLDMEETTPAVDATAPTFEPASPITTDTMAIGSPPDPGREPASDKLPTKP